MPSQKGFGEWKAKDAFAKWLRHPRKGKGAEEAKGAEEKENQSKPKTEIPSRNFTKHLNADSYLQSWGTDAFAGKV